MGNWLGPDPNTRTAWRLVASTFKTATGGTAVFYLDSQGSQLAGIRYYDPNNPATPGSLITGSALTVDFKSELPQFWFPDGDVKVLYVSVDGGPLVEVHAAYPAQLAALATADSTEATARSAADAAEAAARATADTATLATAKGVSLVNAIIFGS